MAILSALSESTLSFLRSITLAFLPPPPNGQPRTNHIQLQSRAKFDLDQFETRVRVEYATVHRLGVRLAMDFSE